MMAGGDPTPPLRLWYMAEGGAPPPMTTPPEGDDVASPIGEERGFSWWGDATPSDGSDAGTEEAPTTSAGGFANASGGEMKGVGMTEALPASGHGVPPEVEL